MCPFSDSPTVAPCRVTKKTPTHSASHTPPINVFFFFFCPTHTTTRRYFRISGKQLLPTFVERRAIVFSRKSAWKPGGVRWWCGINRGCFKHKKPPGGGGEFVFYQQTTPGNPPKKVILTRILYLLLLSFPPSSFSGAGGSLPVTPQILISYLTHATKNLFYRQIAETSE